MTGSDDSALDHVDVPLLGQFSYASADRGRGGAGGWQVLQRTAGIEPMLDELVRYTPAAIESLVAVQDYPVPGLARRLMATAVAGGERLAALHSVPAGRDGSGRPGNVFTHGVVLAEPTTRPAQLWDFPGWLQPYGPREVNAAGLPVTEAFGCADMIPPLEEFLFDPMHWRVGTLAVLVDAVHAALARGPRVVMLVADHDEAARWIQAVQACTDARSAHRIHFSTFERHDIPHLESLDLHLVGLPAVDANAVAKRSGVVVVDCGQFPELGELGGAPHRTPRGDAITVTPWSTILLDRCATADDLPALTGAIDGVRADLPDADWTDPVWPLALVTFEQGSEARLDAAQVLARSTPGAVGGHPGHYQTVAAALDVVLGESAAEQWQALEALRLEGGTELMLGLASANFVVRALGDPDWLAGASPAPRIDDGIRPPASARAQSAARQYLDRLADGPAEVPLIRAAIRGCDLLGALGWDEIPLIAGGLESLTERVAAALPHGVDAIIGDLEQARSATKARIRDVLLSTVRFPSEAAEVADRTLDAVGMTTLEAMSGPEVWIDRGAEVAPLAARAAQCILATPEVYPADVRNRAFFLDAYATLTDRRVSMDGIFRPEPRVANDVGLVMSAAQVRHLLERFGSRVPQHLIDPVLSAAPAEDLPELMAVLRVARHGSADFAEVLVDLGGTRPTGPQLKQTLMILESGLRSGGRLPAGLAGAADTLAVAGALAGVLPVRGQHPSYVSSVGFLGQAVTDQVVEAIAAELVAALEAVAEPRARQWLLERVARHSPGSPARSKRMRWVGDCGGDRPVVDRLLVSIARQRRIVVTTDAVAAVAASFVDQGQGDPGLRGLERFLQKWARDHDLAEQRGPGDWLLKMSGGRRRTTNDTDQRNRGRS